MAYQIFSVLVSNHFGVLTRVTTLFSGRGFNIRGLSVGETDDPAQSRITITTEADAFLTEQIEKQLMKLEDVKKVSLLPQGGYVGRELLLIKLAYGESDYPEIEKVVSLAGGRIADKSESCLIAEITGEAEHIEGFVAAMKDRRILEMSRTGLSALQTGEKTIRS